jgi:neutral ceramidase
LSFQALELWDAESVELTGSIDYIHQNVDMPTYEVDGKTLCSPTMGYAFAAGTTDGCGMVSQDDLCVIFSSCKFSKKLVQKLKLQFNFVQGETSGNPFWDAVSKFLAEPSDETIACQHPKPILLDTGDVEFPYAWDPKIVPTQIIKATTRPLNLITV